MVHNSRRGGIESGVSLHGTVFQSEDFVGREDILEKLEESFTSRRDYQPRIALWGLGGVGYDYPSHPEAEETN